VNPGHAIQLRDTFGMLDQVSKEDNFDYIHGLSESSQPSVGATTLGIDEGAKYSAWVFEDEQLATSVRNYLQNEGLRNGYETVETDGRVLKAVGPDKGVVDDFVGDRVVGMPHI